jgi:hypothetical protein
MDKVALDVKALETWELANTSLWFVLQVNLMVRWQVKRLPVLEGSLHQSNSALISGIT